MNYLINDTNHSIQSRFSHISSTTPDQLCLRVPKSKAEAPWELTYAEVDAWSNQLAAQLVDNEVKVGDRVGLCVERSAAAVVAMLAINKIGACYVPISPDYPKDRAQLIVDDTNISIAFATPIFATKMQRVGVTTLLLDEHPASDASGASAYCHEGNPDDPAYIIYTSGSTGRPKGVEVPHRGVLRLTDTHNEYCTFGSDKRFLQLAPLFFDAATFEVWGPLLNGGCCVVQPGDGMPDPQILADVLKTESITTLWLTSSLFNWLIDNEALLDSPVKELLVGGEALSLAHIKRAYDQLPGVQLINGYGPTETTTFACCYRIPRDIPADWTAIPIGKPIYKTDLIVCDDDGKTVQDGEQGELFIGGDGVSLSYLNLPELTSERFTELELEGEKIRFYRTGDQVKINADGLLEYCGRIDDQVKISGYRIELGEINNCLTSHTGIRDAAVVVHTGETGSRRLVAYLVPAQADAQTPVAQVRKFTQKALPHYMIPNTWMYVEKLPLTPNGKLDKKALPGPIAARPDIGIACVVPKDGAETLLASMWKEQLGLQEVGVNDRYFELGGTSIGAVNFVAQLSNELKQRVPIATFFYAPTIRSFATALWSDHYDVMAARFPSQASQHQQVEDDLSQYESRDNLDAEDIAIIGMAGRYPGAEDTDQLWENIRDGVESLSFATDEELRSAGVSEDDIQDPEYVRAYFTVDDLAYFDASFFGYQPREAELMDPQHRLFLEVAYTALDNAGYANTENYTGRIGVFGGTARDAYVHHYVTKHPVYSQDLAEFYVNMGNDKNFPSTRVAYKLNLKGPAVNIQTACSTSGTALHIASQNLLNGECDMALIGGCRGLVPEKTGYRNLEESALSSDGHLRVFDASASGMVRGSGASFLVIKRLSDALRDKDCIRAVIKSTAINNDGNAKVGFTAPSVEGQTEVITKALVKAGVTPEQIGYVEAHGTGTLLGDPIEVTALTKSYRRFTQANDFCHIGSIKSNIGHLDAGSAATGIVKAILALEHGQIPPVVNFSKPNPNIDFENSPFKVNKELEDWTTTNGGKRIAAVSSFGLGGTNFHGIFEQAPEQARDHTGVLRPNQLITLSAKSATSLNYNIANVRRHIEKHANIPVADLAFSLNSSRPEFTQRAMMVADENRQFSALKFNTASATAAPTSVPDCAFIFNANKTNIQVAPLLYTREPVFKQYVDVCADIFLTDHNIDVLPLLTSHEICKAARNEEPSTNICAALFCTEYALAKLWITWTAAPTTIIANKAALAHAACIADMLSLHKAIEVSVAIARDSYQGTTAPTSVSHNDDATTNLAGALERILPAVAKVPLLAAETGETVSIPALMAVDAWVDRDNSSTIVKAPSIDRALFDASLYESSWLLDIGCQSAITNPNSENSAVLLADNNDESQLYKQLQTTLGEYWLAGGCVNWDNFYKGQPVYKTPLPTFKFDRSRHLIDLPERQPQLVLLDASSKDELSQSIINWQQTADQHTNFAQQGVSSFTDNAQPYRIGFAANTPRQIAAALSDKKLASTLHQAAPATACETVFLLPGGGAQYLQMARGLYEQHPVVRKVMDEGFAIHAAKHGDDLRKLVFPGDAATSWAESNIQKPSVQLPAIFIVEVALARLWMHWGVKPAALIGHSMGENTAAHLAGVLTFEQALELVSLRGRLFEQVEPGGMLSCALSAEEAKDFLGEKFDLATVNGPNQTTLSGPHDDLEALKHQLDQENIEAQLIPINIAAHSRYLEPILSDFHAYLASIDLHKPEIPFVSNLTGTWITDTEAQDPDYWTKHLRNAIRFSDGVNTLLDNPNRIYLEVGPGKILGSLVKLHSKDLGQKVVSSLRHNQEDVPDVVHALNTLGLLWSMGVELDWSAVQHDFPGCCVRLPVAVPIAQGNASITAVPPPVIPVQQAANAPEVQASPNAPAANLLSRPEYIEAKIKDTLYEMSGIPVESLDVDTTFVDLGFDSLFLTQTNGQFKKIFKVKLTLRQLMSEAPTIAQLSAFIDSQLPADALQEELAATSPQPDIAGGAPAGAATMDIANLATGDTNSLLQVLASQIQTSNALIAALQGGGVPAAATQSPAAKPTIPVTPSPTSPVIAAGKNSADAAGEAFGHGPFRPIVKSVTGKLTEQQQAFLDEFIEFYASKTSKSKQIAADIRPYYADPRTVLGFKTLWKEITYSIVAERSKGGRTWDVDGNEYIDCMGGFGAIFFGHAPDFIMDAVKAQAEITVDYGPQSAKAGETARLICEMTGMDRASFCNTGSEAVLAATRIARTVTGNDLIVTFSGDYHGVFDEMLIRSQVIGGQRKNLPIAPGIPRDSNSNVLMLEYDNPESLTIIRERADEIAGVLIEPIQSRHPEIQPKEFIHQVREITRELEIPMIFDEVVTGFRLHPRGAQAWFDVEVDIACYGKVIGGGLPIGVVAGKSQFMDVLDGGPWQFGDDSFPEAGVTYFAGTFVRHPLAIAAANAVVKKLKEEGPKLQHALNRKTALFAERVNRRYREQDIPVEIIYFGSVFLVRYRGEPDYEFLFFLILRIYGGHHIWGPRPGFMTVAHTEEDIELLIQAFITAGEEFRRGGFFHALEDRTEEFYPWTAAQQEVWLACDLGAAASSAYNEQVVFNIEQNINIDILQFAVDRTINRHPALRSVVSPNKQGMLVKHYQKPRVKIADISDARSEADVTLSLEKLKRENIDQAFDFFNGPLVCVTLIKLRNNQNQICIAASHLVCDGWSLEKVTEDIAGFYTAIAQGRHYQVNEVPELSTFHHLENERRQSEEFADAKMYWERVYQNSELPTLELPLDHARPRVRKFDGQRIECRFDKNLIQPLREMAKEKGCTSFVLLLTAFNVLLTKLCGEKDVIVGVPSAGQPNIGLPKLVSHCVNFLPLRSEINPEYAFEQLMLEIRDNFLDAKDNQDFAYGEILQNFNIPRVPGRIPLVCANFNLDFPFNRIEFDGANGEFLTTPRSFVKYDLSFNLTDEGDFLRVEVDYCSALFNQDTIERWVSYFKNILQKIVDEPESQIKDIPLANDGSINERLTHWNDTAVDYALDKITLSSLLNDSFQENANNIALAYEGQTLSYCELDRYSNQVAHLLVEEGIGRDDCVALYMDRSQEMVVAICGILKAGAAYLPLDVEHPRSRIDYILQEADAKMLFCSSHLYTELANNPLALALTLGSTPLIEQPETALDSKVSPDCLAYVIYTSGSTGKPKGVMNEHRGVCNRLLWMREKIGLSSDDRVLQKTPYTFDVSVWELLLPLISGATLIIAKPGGHKNSEYLIKTIVNQQISHIHFVPSMLYLLLADPQARRCDSLKNIICSGEALSKKLQDDCLQVLPYAQLYNLYGPTEAAIDVTAWRCRPSETAENVPIGKPIANTQIYILDDCGNQVDIGIPGELHIGGVQVARGYLNREELTEEKFIPDPYSSNANARLYKTGDLARYRADGTIEYLGRNDFQVKIRGLRIELGEIEAALEEHEEIQRAIVVVREDRENDQRLVSYLQTQNNTIASDGILRTFLASRLPEYMIPQHFVALPELPLTSSGKVDRKDLPAPEMDAVNTGDFVEPQGAVETEVTQLMAESLGLKAVSVEADFFELGGHSLIGTQWFSKINQQLGVSVPLNMLFEEPTARGISTYVTKERAGNSEHKVHIKIPARDSSKPLPASSQQQRLWYLEQIEPEYIAHNNVAAFRLRGNLNIDAMQQVFETIAARHFAIRCNVEMIDGVLQQTENKNFSLDLTPENISAFNVDNVDNLVEEIRQRCAATMNVERDQLFNAHLVRISENDYLLWTLIHHLVFDGWSYDILILEVCELYNAIVAGRSNPLPALPTSYADYSAWQRSWLEGPYIGQQLEYWKQHLEGELPFLEMGFCKPRPKKQLQKAATVNFSLDEQLVQQLEKEAIRHKCTLFMLLTSVYLLALHRYSQQEDIVIGVPISGRHSEDLNHLLGFFVNTLALRFPIDPAASYNDWVQQVRSVCLGGFNHQHMPFEILAQEINPPRDLSRSPIYQTMFVFQDVRNRTQEMQGIAKEQIAIGRAGVQTDIDSWTRREANGVKGGIEFPVDLFDIEDMQEFSKSFVEIARSIIETPEKTVAQLTSANEKHLALFAEWNATDSTLESFAPFINLLSHQSQSRTNRTAVVYRDQSLTYGELEQQICQTANYLSANGVQAGDLIGIMLSRSCTMLVSVLALWRVGAAYVPLDPEYPEQRLQHMIETADIKLILSELSLNELLPDCETARVLVDCKKDILSQSTKAPLSPNKPEDLAYVIFTSGSTGTPKGVQISHANVVNFLLSMQKRPGFSKKDSLLSVTTLSFDISVLELFLPLLAGGKVIIADNHETVDGAAIKQLLADKAVTTMQATPSTWRMLLKSGWRGTNDFRILCGGEAFPPDLLGQLHGKAREIWNMFGPTETTVWSTCYPLHQTHESIKIGSPIDNTQCYVLNSQLLPTAVGVAGELYIGGAGLSPGYLDADKLTSEVFINTGYGQLYKTGDLAKWDSEGNLEYLQRIDSQVKVRGFRIELSEIESALTKIDGITHAVARVHRLSETDRRLVGYYCQQANHNITNTDLRKTLRLILPDYMIPQLFVELDRVPLTPNGKIDRKALPSPLQNLAVQDAILAPRDGTEETLVAIWSDVLKVDEISVESNFFDIGGHSLIALEVIYRIEKQFNVRIKPLDMLLQTLEQIAATIRTSAIDKQDASPSPESPTSESSADKSHSWKSKLISKLRR